MAGHIWHNSDQGAGSLGRTTTTMIHKAGILPLWLPGHGAASAAPPPEPAWQGIAATTAVEASTASATSQDPLGWAKGVYMAAEAQDSLRSH